jgi:predicted nucleotidyltransferase
MRISSEQRKAIKSVLKSVFKTNAIYLFGSRADDSKRGGDLDLLVIGDGPFSMDNILKARMELIRRLGEQKIDLLYEKKGELSTFGRVAKARAVKL